MTWLASLGVALLTAVLAMFGAGLVAIGAVEWYQISSFEGGSGYFVVGMALLGLIGGFVIGLIVALVRAQQPASRFVSTLGISCGAVAVVLAAIAGVSWLLADIPPTIDGEELFLVAEIRWPASGTNPGAHVIPSADVSPGAGRSPDAGARTGAAATADSDKDGSPVAHAFANAVPSLRLGALSGNTARRMESGPLFVDDARLENGRWIVPGAVPIFTSRGSRVLEVGAGAKSLAGFLVPLPGHPGKAQREWSAWLPRTREGAPAETPKFPFSYRFKVIKQSEPMRSTRIGSFDIDTIASYFYNVAGSDLLAAKSTFRVRYNGQPIGELSGGSSVTIATVAVVGRSNGAKGALFATVDDPEHPTRCALVIDEGSTARVQWVDGCVANRPMRPLTTTTGADTPRTSQEPLPGWLDRVTFAEPGLFVVGDAVMDTRTLTSAAFQMQFPEGVVDVYMNPAVPPLDLSPDERSFVWLTADSGEGPHLGVTDWKTGRSYLLSIDRERMQAPAESSSIDTAWLRQHFEWTRGADGIDLLAERAR